MVNLFSFDVVLPCYNPGKAWSEVAFEYFKRLKTVYGEQFINLIIVNDGSQFSVDPSFLKNNISGLIWIEYSINRGKGFALRKGVATSTSDFCLYTDLDFPFGIESLQDTYQKLANGADVVMGRRTAEYYKRLPLKRWAISKVTNIMNRLILKVPFNDTQAGLKGFNKNGKELFLNTKINSFLFDTEFILLAERHKLKISTVHVFPRDEVRFSSIGLRVLQKELSNFVILLRKQ